MNISVVVDGELADALRRVSDRADQYLTDSLAEIGSKGEDVAKGLAPENEGRFKRSISHELDRRSVTVGSTSRRAHLVEEGRKPGKMAPPTLIASIFNVDDQEAFLIARAIGQHGTVGAHVFALTRAAMRFEVKRVAAELAAALSLDRV